MEEMNIEEEKIIGKERIFHHLLERSKNEWNQRKGIFSFVWYTKAKENIICKNTFHLSSTLPNINLKNKAYELLNLIKLTFI